MKKITLTITVFCLSVMAMAFNFMPNNAYADTQKPSSKASYLIDVDSGTEIYKNNENERLKIASMTKIMLLLLCYDNINDGKLSLDETITVSQTASGMGGSQAFLEANGNYLVKDLIKSVIVASANDSSVALAERLYGSEENCVNEMNKRAESLNLKNTLFSNCTGLPKPMQYSSAKDIAIIFKELIKNKNYFEYSNVWLDKIDHKSNSTELANTNKLIRYYNGCDGGKTGFTNEAGFCLTATAKRGNMRLISVVIGSESSKSRFKEVSDMFNNGFNNYQSKAVVDCNNYEEETTRVLKGEVDEVKVKPEKDFFIFTKKGENCDIKLEKTLEKVQAPLKSGDTVGKIVVYKNGVEVGSVNLVATCDVKKLNYFGYLQKILQAW